MKNQLENGTLKLFPTGRIDSNNAESVAKEIFDAAENSEFTQLVVDADGLEYVSSAGLRIFLRLKKAYPNLKVTNVSSDVYEIFDMTGFTDIMTIEKAYRKVSIDGCEVIGVGANGTVYRVDSDTIVKVYNNPDSFDDIARERNLAKKAFVLGINTAISYDIVKVGDSFGTMFEMLNAESLAKCVAEDQQNKEHYIDLYVDLLKKIHSTVTSDDDIPPIKDVALRWLKTATPVLDGQTAEKLTALVEAVPNSNNVLHGDYHLKNVMLQNGEAILIDMDTLCVGNPIFEFGSIFNAYVGFTALHPENAGKFLGITAEDSRLVWNKTLEKYFGTTDKEKLARFEDKAKTVGYLRLLHRAIRRSNGNDEYVQAIEFYKSELKRLVAGIDSLAL